MGGKIRRVFGRVSARLKEEPWSARIIGVVGLLLALVSAVDQKFIPFLDQYAGATKWVAFGLTLVLLIVSAWFAADMRRIKRWSTVSDDLRSRVMELDSLHPDALRASLSSVHDEDKAVARGDELRKAVAAVATVYAEARRAPRAKEVARVEAAAAAAMDPTIKHRSTTTLGAESSDVFDSWQSVARLRSGARRASVELASVGDGSAVTGSKAIDQSPDPRGRWSELVGLAAVLVGLLAVPNVAGSLADGATEPQDGSSTSTTAASGSNPPSDTAVAALAELNGAIGDLTSILASDESTSDVAANLAGLGTHLESISAALDPDAAREVAVVDTVVAGSTLWAKAIEFCGGGTAREIAADVISLWHANSAVIGDDPNVMKVDDDLTVACAG